MFSILFLSIDLDPLPILKATAKNERSEFPASKLIDSKNSTFYHSAGTTTSMPWIQLELQPGSIVHRVHITNRVDCCGSKLRNLEVRVGNEVREQDQQGRLTSNSLCNNWVGPGKNGEVVVVECSQPITGKYITIQIMDKGHKEPMHIAEVEAFGTIAGKQNTNKIIALYI